MARRKARPALCALADRVGILPGYVPVGGGWRETSDAAREALLGALGFSAATEAAARAELAALDARARERLLEPIAVSREGPPRRLVARVARGTARYAMHVREESGAEHERSGRVRVGARGALARLPLPALPLGLHRVTLRVVDASDTAREEEQTLVVAPREACSLREHIGRRRVFGLLTQLYALRSRRGFGVGDTRDLRTLVRFARSIGATFVGVNPLHALRNRFPDVSPYGPMSRLFRNPIYLDVTAVPELAEASEARNRLASAELRAELERLRSADSVDYARVAACQRTVLEPLHRVFAARHRGRRTARGRAYAAFRERRGALLEDFATFCALAEARPRAAPESRGAAEDWRRWPPELRHPRSEAVRGFRKRHFEAVDFHAWLQFELDRQLAGVAAEARDEGVPLGLYPDLAVGSAPSGFDPWAFPGLFVEGARLGAPPDDYSATGQDWGLPPLDPRRLREDGYRFWVELLRGGFEHAGMLRIDHVLGLLRQWWVPTGRSAVDGAYVRFPFDELLAVLALESRRAGTVVVGEDLGTVPRGLAAALARAGVLSSRVLFFERDPRGSFRASARYSRRALVTATTHDLPPLAAFASGSDLDLRRDVGVIESDAALAGARAERERARRALLRRLAAERLLPRPAKSPSAPDLCAAVTAFVCRTPAPLVGIALDDLAGEDRPVNLPGVSMERYPSWTRRMRLALEEIPTDPGVRRALAGTRRRGGPKR